MHDDLLDALTRELVNEHGAHTVLLYGSHADASAGPGSDYDLAAFARVPAARRVTRFVEGAYVDAFVHPDTVLSAPGAEHLALRSSTMLCGDRAQVDRFVAALDAVHARGPEPLGPGEASARRLWAHKMLERLQRGDPEGNYRRAWLLAALLEDWFVLRGRWFEGPKKALRWLEQNDAPLHAAFCRALEPDADVDAIRNLVVLAVGQRADPCQRCAGGDSDASL